MKITSFNQIYGTEDISSALGFFEGLGFRVIHEFKKEGFELCTLENEEGLRFDIINNDYVRANKVNGFFSCRLNVSDMNEAIEYFEKNGAERVSPLIQEGPSRELINFRTKNGDIYCVIHHKK